MLFQQLGPSGERESLRACMHTQWLYYTSMYDVINIIKYVLRTYVRSLARLCICLTLWEQLPQLYPIILTQVLAYAVDLSHIPCKYIVYVMCKDLHIMLLYGCCILYVHVHPSVYPIHQSMCICPSVHVVTQLPGDAQYYTRLVYTYPPVKQPPAFDSLLILINHSLILHNQTNEEMHMAAVQLLLYIPVY